MNPHKKAGSLYLIPSSLGASDIGTFWPSENTKVVKNIVHFIVENIRTARRFLRSVGYDKSFEDARFFLLNKHTKQDYISNFLNPCHEGLDSGLLSEAGCPCIADPGRVVVELAHQSGIEVIPLIGPSSIMLALMGSGFNGQNFSFVGYLPIDKAERVRKIKNLETTSSREDQTQIFMEAPFRNNQLLESLVNTLNPETKLCIACNLTIPGQFIKTHSIAHWKKQMPDLHKRPSIFLVYSR